MATLLSVRESKEKIIEAGLCFLQYIYGDKKKTLSALRFLAYNRMVAKKSLNPNRLPPTIASATEHILRAYLQYHNWVMLDADSLNPLDYGWKSAPGGTYELQLQQKL